MPSPRLNHSQRDSSEFHENNNIVSSPLHWQTKEEPPPAVADNFTAQQRTNPHNRCCADVIINHLQEVNQVSEATEAQTPTWIKWTSGCLHYSRGATIRLWKGLWTVEYDRNKWFKSVLLFNGKALFAPAVVAAHSFFRLQRINEDDGLHHMLEDCLTFNASPRRRSVRPQQTIRHKWRSQQRKHLRRNDHLLLLLLLRFLLHNFTNRRQLYPTS